MKELKSVNSLSTESKKFYNKIFNKYQMEVHHEKILLLACQCLDRITMAKKLIDKGMLIKDRFEQIKPNPACRIEAQNKIIFTRLIRELGLDLEVKK